MATTIKSETLPTKDSSVLKKDPLPVIENPAKKVVLVKEKSTEEPAQVEEKQKQSMEMEVDSSAEDVMSPSNQT